MSRLDGKIALVTGSSSGIGAALAVGFAERGADVIVNYCHNSTGAEETAARVLELGRRCLVVQADVGIAADVERMFDQTDETFGRLDILVNNAGITLKAPFLETTEEEWDGMMRTNLKSVFLCSRAAAKRMMSSRGGAILNVSSTHASATTHHFAAYAATKGGM